MPSTSRCRRKGIQSPDSPDLREMGRRIAGDKEGSRVDLVVMPAVAVWFICWGAVCWRRGGLPLPSSLPRRFDCIEAQYAGEEKGMCAEFVAPFVSPASWGSSPETRRQLRRGRRSIASPALRWIEGDRQWDGRGSHLSSPLLFGSELLGELILLLSTSTTATIVEPSIQVTASSCIAPSCLPPKTMASSSYVAPQHQHPICLTFWNCFCNYMSRVGIL